MKQKGFTLIELLAVIVILAIIAVIATPMVLNTIDDARKGAAKSSAYSYIEEVETEVAKYMLDNNGTSYSAGKYDISTLSTDLGVEVKGDAPSAGNICIGSNGVVTKASLKINNYVVSYDGKETATTDLDEIEDISCDGITSGDITTPEVVNTIYANGTAIYYNPETNTTCTEAEAVSTTGTKAGCMKWYTFNDSTESTTVNMILDHNTTALVAWNSSGNNADGMNEVATSLTSDTSTWTSGLNPRLITADEIAQITGNTTFNSATSTYDEGFFFDSNSQTQTATTQGASNYAWLYDYTNECTSNGCNVADSSNYGYWTSTPIAGSPYKAWLVARIGLLDDYYVDYASSFGVRPVITVSKSVIQ